MSEGNLSITTWLASQFFDPHKENGLLVAELDRRLPGPLCSIAAISLDSLTYINRTGETNDDIETKFKDMVFWLNNISEDTATKPASSVLSCALRTPEVPRRVLTTILLYGPTEDVQARFEAIQNVLEVVRQDAERRSEEAARQEEEEQREAQTESAGDGEEGDSDAD